MLRTPDMAVVPQAPSVARGTLARRLAAEALGTTLLLAIVIGVLARCLSDTFAGVGPSPAPAFILAQLAGAAVATTLGGWLLRKGCPR